MRRLCPSVCMMELRRDACGFLDELRSVYISVCSRIKRVFTENCEISVNGGRVVSEYAACPRRIYRTWPEKEAKTDV